MSHQPNFVLATNAADSTAHFENKGGLRKRNDSAPSQRRLQTEPCVLLHKMILMEDFTEIEEIDCYDPSTDTYAEISSHAEGDSHRYLLSKFHSGEIVSGQSTLMQEGAYFDENGSLLVEDLEDVQIEKGPETRRQLLTASINMLAVRVKAADSTTSSSQAQISDAWFGTNGDPVNFKSQYGACSYGKLQVNAANTGTVTNGVFEVTIPNNVQGVSNSVIRNSVSTALSNSLGTLPSAQYNYVMQCLPPGTSGGWIAYAYINWYLSVYNDGWCNSVSAQMHGKLHCNV
jgi:hypothetical protein